MRGGEQWRDIPGYDGLYQASSLGRVRTWKSKDGRGRRPEPLIMRQNLRDNSYRLNIRHGGKRNYSSVAALVYAAFYGPVPKGRIVFHKNLVATDNRPDNLFLGTAATHGYFLCAKNGKHGSRRMPVVKLNDALEIVDTYPSGRAADAENGFCPCQLQRYLNLRRKTVIAPDGYIYAWDDDAWMRRTLRRAKAELAAKGIRFTDPFTEEYYNLPPDPLDGLDLEAIPWADAPGGGGHYFGTFPAYRLRGNKTEGMRA